MSTAQVTTPAEAASRCVRPLWCLATSSVKAAMNTLLWAQDGKGRARTPRASHVHAVVGRTWRHAH